ncbi:MAG: hypothetical protein AAEJ52_04655, partial [Myxococcota bacterium]
LLERIADANGATLPARAHELDALPTECSTGDLEGDLDALRVLRHEETCLCACLDLGGVIPFEEVSCFLSVLAETIARRALHLASLGIRSESNLSVVGMGKIAGREFTYHSDLDLIFLYGGGAAGTSRIGQRLISFLGTMTGAGIAYAVDTRLRPSGRQGVLVTSYSSYERYQREQAETWEHMALLRARTIAGEMDSAQQVLERVREPVLTRESNPWDYIAELRERVETERSVVSDTALSLKTGTGGLMDVDFLASGGLLERPGRSFPPIPSVPAMLQTLARSARLSQLLQDYRFLRLVESRARWAAGRGVDEIRTDTTDLDLLGELVEPGTSGVEMRQELDAARSRIRATFESVTSARTISALTD